VLFAEVREVPVLGLTLDVPTLASVNVASLVLTLAALLAVFRFKVGMIPVLAASSLAGVTA
jgi:chromate transporter